MRPTIGLDVDGVLYKFEATARYMLRSMRNGPSALDRESQSWDYIREHVQPADWRWLWDEGVKLGLFRYGHLYKGAIEGVRDLAVTADLVVVTSRPANAVPDTLAWLAYQKFPLAGVNILSNGQSKLEVVPGPNMFIDDGPHNLWDFHNERVPHVRFARPWNRKAEVPCESDDVDPRLCRTGYDWPEVVQETQKMLKTRRAA